MTDHLGSTVLLTDKEGNIVWQDDFTPFGEEAGESGFLERDGFYTGKKIDPDTGLYYFNARWYDPSLGRFITEDPVKDGINWYGYVANNPMTFTDPTGLYRTDYWNMSDDDVKKSKDTRDKLDRDRSERKEKDNNNTTQQTPDKNTTLDEPWNWDEYSDLPANGAAIPTNDIFKAIVGGNALMKNFAGSFLSGAAITLIDSAKKGELSFEKTVPGMLLGDLSTALTSSIATSQIGQVLLDGIGGGISSVAATALIEEKITPKSAAISFSCGTLLSGGLSAISNLGRYINFQVL